MSRPVVIGLIVVLLLCCCTGAGATGLATAGGGLALFSAVQGPNSTVNAYYDAVKKEDWATAQAQLSPNFRAQVTPAQIQKSFQDNAAKDGKIVSLNITNTNINGTEATVDATLKRERAEGKVSADLVKVDNEWKIDGFN